MAGLAWINPLYLAGLALLAIPVLIHLAQKQHDSSTRFPSLMFLERIPRREKRRFEIRNWLLLLLRCLLLALLALAFARPFFSGAGEAAALDPERSDSVILLDRSYSMRIGDGWERARATALELVDARATADRVGLILFDEETLLLSDLTGDTAALRALLRESSPGYRATRLASAIEQAARLLEGSTAGRKRIVMISDFRGEAAPRVPRIAADIEFETRPIELAGNANAALTAVEILPSSNSAADEFALAVEIANRADDILQTTLSLELDGRVLARRALELPAGAAVSETFDRVPVNADLQRGLLRLGDDALEADNRLHFVYSRTQQLPVLVVERDTPRANQAVYLDNALRLARAPAFRVERRSVDELEPADLQNRAAIVLDDVAVPGGELGDALGAFVAAGGGLLVAVGDTAPVYWPDGDDGFLPGSPDRRVDAVRGTAFELAGFAAAHPLAAALGPRQVADLAGASVFSYRVFEPNDGDRVLARFDDGGAALLERAVGDGRVLLLTTTLDRHWNDLALQPAFVPLLQQALRYLTAYQAPAGDTRIGSVVDVLRHARALAGGDALVAAADAGPLVIESPSTRALRLQRDAALLTLDEPGFYQVHNAAPGDVEIVVAANVDPAESAPDGLDLERFVEDIRTSAAAPRADAAPTLRQAAAREREQRLAFAILAALLVLLLVEALSANWLGIRRSARRKEA